MEVDAVKILLLVGLGAGVWMLWQMRGEWLRKAKVDFNVLDMHQAEDDLSAETEARLRAAFEKIEEVHDLSIEEVLSDFRRDHNMEEEVKILEHIAAIYEGSVKGFKLNKKKAVFSLLMSFSFEDLRAVAPEKLAGDLLSPKEAESIRKKFYGK